MRQNREYELKFELPAQAGEGLPRHPLLDAALPRRDSKRLASTYFDTPEAALRGRLISLRVRRSGSTLVQTLKSAGRSRLDRAEWEFEGGGTRPDIEWLRRTPLRSIFAGDLLDALAPRFTVDVTRIVLPLRYGGAEIEAAVDSGDIRAGENRLAVSEFELELKRGGKGPVLALARILARDLPLTLSLASKSERGYAVADGSWGRPIRELRPNLGEARSLRAAFAAAAETCVHALASNAALIPGGCDRGEAVHRTRIALRHLRALVALFRPALRRRRLAGVNAEIKWLSALLGQARDSDVMAATLEADPAGVPAEARQLLEAGRRSAHEALDAALLSPRWRLLLIELVAFCGDGVRRRRRSRAAGPYLRRRLAGTHEALCARSRGWRRHSVEHSHDLRKQAKMLRYDLDLLGTLPGLDLKRRGLARLGRDLQLLQQHLGEVQDRAVLRERLAASPLATMGQDGGGPDEQRRDRQALTHAHEAARRIRRSTVL